jgi:excisionase family DNA binding protein
MDRELLNITEAAETCGVSRRTIYNWLATNKIQAVRTAGGCVRVYADTLFRELKPSEIKTNGRTKESE